MIRQKYWSVKIIIDESSLLAHLMMLTGSYAEQFDVLAVIRPRRDSVRKLLVEKHWQKYEREKEDKHVMERRIMADLTTQL